MWHRSNYNFFMSQMQLVLSNYWWRKIWFLKCDVSWLFSDWWWNKTFTERWMHQVGLVRDLKMWDLISTGNQLPNACLSSILFFLKKSNETRYHLFIWVRFRWLKFCLIASFSPDLRGNKMNQKNWLLNSMDTENLWLMNVRSQILVNLLHT